MAEDVCDIILLLFCLIILSKTIIIVEREGANPNEGMIYYIAACAVPF